MTGTAEIERRAELRELDPRAGRIENRWRRWIRSRSTESLLASKQRKPEARGSARHRQRSRLRTQVAEHQRGADRRIAALDYHPSLALATALAFAETDLRQILAAVRQASILFAERDERAMES